MTGYTVHTGSNEKFSAGWDNIFAKPGKSSTSQSPQPARRTKAAKVATPKQQTAATKTASPKKSATRKK